LLEVEEEVLIQLVLTLVEVVVPEVIESHQEIQALIQQAL
jgi:hypothetical protein